MTNWQCAICMHDSRIGAYDLDDKPVTIINGQLVCMDHTGYVQGGIFTSALSIALGEEPPTDEG
jgi:hypothetical protein